MRKPPGPHGPFAQWLVAQRKRRGFARQVDALEAYRRMAGLHIAPSEYAQWESGSRVPRENNMKRRALIEFYGSAPEAPEPEPSAPDLFGLIADHTEAIRELVAQLQAERLQRQQLEELLLGVLEGLPGPHNRSTKAGEAGGQSNGPASGPLGASQR